MMRLALLLSLAILYAVYLSALMIDRVVSDSGSAKMESLLPSPPGDSALGV
jgi:hypothetical protein